MPLPRFQSKALQEHVDSTLLQKLRVTKQPRIETATYGSLYGAEYDCPGSLEYIVYTSSILCTNSKQKKDLPDNTGGCDQIVLILEELEE